MATVAHEILPLEPGDRLSRGEFLRRWKAHPEIKKAELIGGIVYMASPVSIDHGEMDNNVGLWLGVYAAFTPGTKAGNNATALMLEEEATQPDSQLRILPEAGGQSRVERKYLHGAPEQVTEVCRSSAAYDLHQKLEVYEQAGVQEYVAVLLYEREVRWYRLTDQGYIVIPTPDDGIQRSLLAGSMAAVLDTLRRGLDSPEHAAFVEQLARRMAK